MTDGEENNTLKGSCLEWLGIINIGERVWTKMAFLIMPG